jgi:tetratricopeptide (TPR) repeat protein
VELLEEAVRRSAAKFGRDHPDTLHAMNILALSYLDAGEGAKAVQLLEEAVRRATATLGPDDPDTLGRVNNLGKAYARTRQGAKAAAAFGRYVAGQRQQLPEDSPQLAAVLAAVSIELLSSEQYTAVEELLREALAIREKQQPDAWTTFNTQSMLGEALLGQKQYADAEPLLLKGYEGMKAREKAIPPPGAPRLPEALDRLIKLYTATNKPDEAKRWRAERARYQSPKEVAPPPREKK